MSSPIYRKRFHLCRWSKDVGCNEVVRQVWAAQRLGTKWLQLQTKLLKKCRGKLTMVSTSWHHPQIKVRIVLEGVDKFSNLIGSVYYPDGESAKDLALELIENGLAKYVEWSASMMEEDAKRQLKSAELQAKKTRLRIWTNYIPPATNSKAIHDQNFTGKVVEVVSGDCIIVADDSVPYGSPLADDAVNLSSKCSNGIFQEGHPVRCSCCCRWTYRFKGDGFWISFPAISGKGEGDDASTPAPPTGTNQQAGLNVAELLVSRGYGTGSAKKTKDFLPFLQRKRCPAREEPFSDEAIALMRRKIMQRDVEIEVETVDRTGTFLGSLWESKTNTAVTLLEAGLAKLQMSFGTDRIPDAHLLMQAEQSAKRQKLKIWENFVEGEEVSNGAVAERKHKEELKVTVTEVLGGGKFYVQVVGDQKVSSIQQQLASLSIQEAPVIGAFNPKKGDIVLAKFSADDSWNRAMIVNAPRAAVESPKDKFEVFYIDYGNQEVVPYSDLCSAQLCSLAHVKIPSLEEDYGQEGCASERAVIEERDTSGGKVKGQGTGTVLMVNLIDTETNSSINAALLKDGLARLEKRKRWEPKEKQAALDELEKFQEEAKSKRLGMWEYGDIQSDDEDTGPPVRKAAGKR
ncbi:Ribonuclease TUDOR 1 [Camellia lanceoleosa]|uniref:Ribonuclease TUDOR 1 n=1 Tax=Camellia lanceoleosa TaxID=1840588 RepID=A0ACC0FF39_9ERIC|nr:Ribonuclease TUDOR 1 [Camellia lanceoleosa]